MAQGTQQRYFIVKGMITNVPPESGTNDDNDLIRSALCQRRRQGHRNMLAESDSDDGMRLCLALRYALGTLPPEDTSMRLPVSNHGYDWKHPADRIELFQVGVCLSVCARCRGTGWFWMRISKPFSLLKRCDRIHNLAHIYDNNIEWHYIWVRVLV